MPTLPAPGDRGADQLDVGITVLRDRVAELRRCISTLSSWFTWLEDEDLGVGNPAAWHTNADTTAAYDQSDRSYLRNPAFAVMTATARCQAGPPTGPPAHMRPRSD